jgi:hypothetical protein
MNKCKLCENVKNNTELFNLDGNHWTSYDYKYKETDQYICCDCIYNKLRESIELVDEHGQKHNKDLIGHIYVLFDDGDFFFTKGGELLFSRSMFRYGGCVADDKYGPIQNKKMHTIMPNAYFSCHQFAYTHTYMLSPNGKLLKAIRKSMIKNGSAI